MTTVAVTGASGFVGQHVLRELGSRGVRVLALSRRPVNVTLGEWRAMDMGCPDRATVELIASCHSLIHLAWGGLPHYLSARHLKEELPAQIAFLQQAVAAGLGSLVVSGTCLEYGMQEGELHESQQTVPHVPYAQAKDRLRSQLEALCAQTHTSLCWARLFYVYGPGQSPNSLWPLLQAAIARGDAKFPMSAGQQVRDFLTIEEAARALVDFALGRADCGVVNLSSGEPITVEQCVRQWVQESGASIELELGKFPYATYEPFRFWGSRSKRDSASRIASSCPMPAEDRATRGD
jgi:nucleoside-diphosphate-sugar epimerase